jgi:hypothetical protein
LAGKDF